MSHKFVVIDEIMEQMEAAKSGIVPGSVTQAVVSGVQNVPSNIKQHSIGGVASTSYTTFPLSPIVKNCCLDKTYLNFEFDVNFDMTFNGLKASKHYLIPFYLGLRDNASIFNQLQILIENSAIWTTTYQREESVLSYNSLPETEIRGNNQYASIEKMREGKYCPMKRYIVDIPASDGNTNKITHITQHFKITIDINRLTPLLSNLHFTTPHMGNLRLKVFIQEFEKCLFICPDYNYFAYIEPAGTTKADIASVLKQPFLNQYWQFYPFYKFVEGVITPQIPFYVYNLDDKLIELPTSVVVSDPTHPERIHQDFMTFDNGGIAEIVQTCFDIKDEEYQRLTDYFASLGSVIIPSQTWSTNVFNNSTITNGGEFPGTQIGNIGGYNLDFVSVWTHPSDHPCTFTNEYLRDVQLILDGRPINPIPYPYINDKCVVDTTQAIIDTDHEEINHDYVSSLTLFNIEDSNEYIKKPLYEYYGNGIEPAAGGTNMTGIRRNYIANPNTFALNFSTNLPDAFHSGACILENSNRQAVLRYNAQSAVDKNEYLHKSTFPLLINHKSDEVVSGFSAFCDCCIVLTYDPARQTCFDGQLSWAAPYA